MKTIYTAIRDQLKTNISALKWIDEDFGQLNGPADKRPPLKFPCALIGIKINECKDLTDKSQQCKAEITIRLAFDTVMHTANSEETTAHQTASLSPYDTIAAVYAALQGFETDNFESLSRKTQFDEKRSGSIFVYQQVYTTGFEDNTAE